MENQTAQTSNIRFPYPDFASSNQSSQTVATPPTPPEPDISEVKYVAKPTEMPGLTTENTDVGILPSEDSTPVSSVVSTLSSIGKAPDSLNDIMPEFKKPKAMIREPKANNLAQPIFKDQEIKKDVEVIKPANGKYTIEELFTITIRKNASDLHFSPGYPPIIRIDGELEEVGDKILTSQDTEELIFATLTDEKKELLEVNREIDYAYTYEAGNNSRFRVNAYYSMKNLSAAFRLIPSRIRTIEELQLPQLYHQFAKLKQGLVLVTGPTGHGKSTTLAAILEDINRTRFCHIVTIEDPVEYLFEGKRALIDQREMNDDTHSWEIALRSALRQDPDVILVGEMRDFETIASAITLAETGHLVFATLHTNSSSQTLDRIIDVFPENQQQQVRAQLANILQAVVAQRLIPLDKGGRRAVSEIMIMNSAVGNLIREGKTHQIDNVIRTSSDLGMVSLEKALVNLVREGAINIQKAQEYAVYPEEVLRLLKA